MGRPLLSRVAGLEDVVAVTGGDICRSYRLSAGGDAFFVKTRHLAPDGFFAAEAAGLDAIRQTGLVRVPRVIGCGHYRGIDFLVLENVPMQAADRRAQAVLGRQLARMHRLPQPCFGGGLDNWIGTTPQPCPAHADWVEFFRLSRLLKQLELAESNGFAADLWPLAEPVLDNLEHWFTGYQVQPSLLHGDLWAGNQSMDDAGQPLLFDPASFLGDRETDLAMSELFGGFAPAFYEAYRAEWPWHQGYARRRDLYQLYHVLNHLNLFGRSYLNQATGLLQRLRRSLAE